MISRHPDLSCKLERSPGARACEFTAYSFAAPELQEAQWPCAPGEVRFSPDGVPTLLHFAPGRWLGPTPDPDVAAMMESAVVAGVGTRVDVEGKWVAMTLSGAGAGRALASTVDIGALLADRACAAVGLFDCPALVVAHGGVYRLWIAASYAEEFEAAIGRLNRDR